MMFKLIGVGAVLAATAAAAQAPNDTIVRNGPSDDPNERICVNEVDTGTRVGHRRICRTRAQWEQLRRQSRVGGETGKQQKQNGGN